MKANLLSFLALATGFWPVWAWYLERLNDKSDEPLGLIALIALAVILFFRVRHAPAAARTLQPSPASPQPGGQLIWLIPAVIYIGTFTFTPNLLKAALALLTLATYAFRQLPILSLGFADFCLVLMSLPVVASINFYLGYPARLIACRITCIFLNILGTRTEQLGTALSSGAAIVEIDAPCSGLKMLWLAWCASLILSSLHRFSFLQTTILLGWTLLLSLVANAVRVTSLFFLESGQISLPYASNNLIHQTTGALSFLLLLAGLLPVVNWLTIIQPYLSGFATRTSSFLTHQTKLAHRPENDVQANNKTTDNGNTINTHNTQQLLLPATRPNLLAIIIALTATLIPLPDTQRFDTSKHKPQLHRQEPTWPEQFRNFPLRRLALSPQQQNFLQGFPGQAALFQAGPHQVLIRYITTPTRQLHPATDCFSGSSYRITLQPIKTGTNNDKWSCCEATNDNQRLIVEERLVDEAGHSYTDISTWYWQAILSQTKGPWWDYTVITETASNSPINMKPEPAF